MLECVVGSFNGVERSSSRSNSQTNGKQKAKQAINICRNHAITKCVVYLLLVAGLCFGDVGHGCWCCILNVFIHHHDRIGPSVLIVEKRNMQTESVV